MEKVYSNTSKVMVDVDGGNNMIYLPLDKIMNQQTQAPRAISQSMPEHNSQQPTSVNSSPAGRSDRFDRGRN
jgi:membrane protease subunit HflK